MSKPKYQTGGRTGDRLTIYLDDDRKAYLLLPTPITKQEKEKLKKYIDMSVEIVCVDE